MRYAPSPTAPDAPKRRFPPAALVAASLLLVGLLVLPTGVLLTRALRPDALVTLLGPGASEALRLSLVTTSLSMLLTVALGTPLAYLLARYRFRGYRLLDTLIDLPIVLPPVVAGLALLLVFGRRGLLGAPLDELGISFAFTTAAVVLAQTFVASPFYVRTLKVSLAAVPSELEGAALTDGATRWQSFRHITLPLAAPAVVEGLVLAWARALGEFGATIVFAGSFAGRTRTLPLAIYAALERDLEAAVGLAGVLTFAALALFLAFRWLAGSRSDG